MTQAPISVEAGFNAVTDHFKLDLREFFTRSNFYLAVQVALLSVSSFRDTPILLFDYVVTLVVVLTGLAISVFWGIVAYGSVKWIGHWRDEVRCLSKEYSETQSYYRIEDWDKVYPLRSAERITMCLPWLFCIIWYLFGIAVLVKYVVSTN